MDPSLKPPVGASEMDGSLEAIESEGDFSLKPPVGSEFDSLKPPVGSEFAEEAN